MSTLRTRFALALLLLAPLYARAQDALPADAAERRAERLERLCAQLERQRAELHVPGLAIAVVQDDRVVLARGLGLADLETGRPVTPETLFAVGSSTKAFTATLVGMLVEEGELGWDEPVAERLPYFTPALRAEDEGATLTLRDLLCHRWGFTRMSLLWAGNALPREAVLRTAAGAEAWDGFREAFHYSNIGYLAAGEAAAAAAGTSWDALVAERLLRPLGMASTTTTVAAAREDERLAAGYAWRAERGVHERLPMRALDAIAPAGALNSNVLDMARWVRLQLGRGAFEGRRLVGEETLRATWEPQVQIAPGVDYGLGWMLRTWKGRRVVEHGGNIDGFACQVAFAPDDGVGFVLLANVTATPLQQTSIPLVLEALLGTRDDAAGAPTDAPDLAAYVGTYVGNFGQFRDAEFKVLERGGKLAVDVPGQMVFELEPPDEEGLWSFAMPVGIAVGFDRDQAGEVVGMVVHQSGFAFELPRKGVEIAPEVPLAELQPYLGVYDVGSKDRLLTVLVQSNRLALDVPGQMVYELRQPGEDGVWRFRISDELGVQFHRDDATGAVDALTMHERGETRRGARVAGETAGASLEDVLALRRNAERGRLLEAGGPVRITARVRFASAGLDGRAVLRIDGPERHRADMEFGAFGSLRMAVDAAGGWTEASFFPFRRLEETELALARLEHPWSACGDWSRFFDAVHLLRAGEREGRAVHVLRLEREGVPPVVYHVDAETGDVLAGESWTHAEGMGNVPVKTVYSDYRDVGGVRTPFRFESRSEVSGRTIFELDAIERVERPDPALFAPPPR